MGFYVKSLNRGNARDLLDKWLDFACRTTKTKGASYCTDHLVYIG